VLKVAVIVLLVLIVLLGLPLGMPMAGTSMCPDCDALGTWSVVCIALLVSVVLFVQRRMTRIFVDRPGRAVLVPVDVLERPPRHSS
jgi:hypothetical protein